MATKSLRVLNSVDQLPGEIPDDRLEEFKIQVGRSQTVTVADGADYKLYSNADQKEVMRQIQTEKFTVRWIARTCRQLHLDWLYTKARVSGSEEDLTVIIDESCRYFTSDAQEHGPRQVIRWINEDRRKLGKIMEAYCYHRSDTQVFDAECRIIRDKLGVVGQATLGECIYDSYEDFMGCYGQDLLRQAAGNARETVAGVRTDLCEA
jgi:hypothetical protein